MRRGPTVTVGRAILGLGLVIVCAGLFFLVLGSESEPTCGGRVMSPSDTCVRYPSGSKSTYDERKSADAGHRATAPVLLTLGAVIAAAGLVTLILPRARATTRRPPAPPPDTDWWTDEGRDR